MKSYPSESILIDAVKRDSIEQIFSDIKMDIAGYVSIWTNSTIKDKQVLTKIGKQMLTLPEHKVLYENLLLKYPDRDLAGIHIGKKCS